MRLTLCSSSMRFHILEALFPIGAFDVQFSSARLHFVTKMQQSIDLIAISESEVQAIVP